MGYRQEISFEEGIKRYLQWLREKKVGLCFSMMRVGPGGFYYMLNIVNALNQLPHNEKPELVIFYKNLLIKEKLRSLQYPFLSFLPVKKTTLLAKVVRKIIKLFRRISTMFLTTHGISSILFFHAITMITLKV